MYIYIHICIYILLLRLLGTEVASQAGPHTPATSDVCSRMLTYAQVCSRMLTYAHVCSRMLMYASRGVL